MAVKSLVIALFVTFQVSVVLSRSTLKPKDEDKTIHESPVLFPHVHASVAKTVEEYFASKPEDLTIKNASSSKMLYDDFDDYNMHVTYDLPIAATIIIIVFSVLSALSLLLGCFLYFYCAKKKASKPGYIVTFNTGHQTVGMQQPEFSATEATTTEQKMQQYPPNNEQKQKQNLYPTVPPTQ